MSDPITSDNEEEKIKRSGTIQSISIAVRFLSALSGSTGPLPLSVLARETGTGLSTAHRYMQSLIKEGLATQDAASGFYDLGPMALNMGVCALKRIDPVEIASKHMKTLAREYAVSCGVAIWAERGPTIVRWYHSADFAINSLRLGDVLPLDNTACGILFQAFLSPETLKTARILQPKNYKGTPPTKEVLRSVHKARWAEMTSHLIPGITGQSAPVFDAQGEMVCALVAVTDLGQLEKPEDKQALCRAAQLINLESGGALAAKSES